MVAAEGGTAGVRAAATPRAGAATTRAARWEEGWGWAWAATRATRPSTSTATAAAPAPTAGTEGAAHRGTR